MCTHSHIGSGDSAAQVNVMDFDLMGEGSVPVKLGVIFEDLQKYCYDQSLQLHMSGLTRTLLSFDRDQSYPAGP